MVSKIAVMALVAIVAAPILLGYGLNINTESYTSWKPDESTSLDVSNYIYNVTDSSKRNYTAADPYLFNSDSFYRDDAPYYPVYNTISSNKTSIAIRSAISYHTGTNFHVAGLSDEFDQIIINGGYDSSNYYDFIFVYNDDTTDTISHVKSLTWRTDAEYGNAGTSATATVSYYYSVNGYATVTMDNLKRMAATLHGTSPGYREQWHSTSTTNNFADILDGWIINSDYAPCTSSSSPYSRTYIQPDGICKDMVLTFNLDSITASKYWLGFYLGSSTQRYHIELFKDTIDGQVKWYYHIYGDSENHELYYDSSISNNTYQLYLDSKGGEFRYVGPWQNIMGVLPPLKTYTFTFEEGSYYWHIPDALPRISVFGQTPTMRIDASKVAAYEYRIMRDAVYDPSTFKDNPITTLSNLRETGSSLTFGGNTYTVTQGNITIGSKQFSLRNMELASTPNGNGQYDNTINGIIISTTATPSDIALNGDWRITIVTSAQSSEQKTSSSWEPGKFTWNGIDDNFLIVGLMASLGAFIALAVYGRRSGAKVMPLLVVCGGAALMFLVMI